MTADGPVPALWLTLLGVFDHVQLIAPAAQRSVDRRCTKRHRRLRPRACTLARLAAIFGWDGGGGLAGIYRLVRAYSSNFERRARGAALVALDADPAGSLAAVSVAASALILAWAVSSPVPTALPRTRASPVAAALPFKRPPRAA
jgi:hypothetical protein